MRSGQAGRAAARDLRECRRRLAKAQAQVDCLETAERQIAEQLSGQIKLEIDTGVYEDAGKVDAAADRLIDSPQMRDDLSATE